MARGRVHRFRGRPVGSHSCVERSMDDLSELVGPFTFVGTNVVGPRIELTYRIGEHLDFTEVVELPAALEDSPAARRAVRILHLVAGVSYYKCIAPAALVVASLDAAEKALVHGLYDQGLREFAYRNGLAVPLPVEVVASGEVGAATFDAASPSAVAADGSPGGGLSGALVPIGGGKDSALVAALVPDGELFAVNPVGAHVALGAALGRPVASATRTMDPALRALVAAGAPNGHVPVTAITSAVSVLAALTLGRRDVLMGIERSADEPSLVTADGVAVNHQYSKSSEAEELLRAVFEPTGVRYLSLLRPLTELAIGAGVARRGLAADIVSCNRVFTVWNENTASREQRPCGDCAKCLFTALMLAPCSTPFEIEESYGRALLDESEHVTEVQALWSAEKPFDCVGERLETAAALVLLSVTEGWKDQVVVRALGEEAASMLADAGIEAGSFLTVEGLEGLPADYREVIASLRPDLASVPGSTVASR